MGKRKLSGLGTRKGQGRPATDGFATATAAGFMVTKAAPATGQARGQASPNNKRGGKGSSGGVAAKQSTFLVAPPSAVKVTCGVLELELNGQ